MTTGAEILLEDLMGEFFNPEKGIWVWLSTLVDVCGLSIVWIFLCLSLIHI